MTNTFKLDPKGETAPRHSCEASPPNETRSNKNKLSGLSPRLWLTGLTQGALFPGRREKGENRHPLRPGAPRPRASLLRRKSPGRSDSDASGYARPCVFKRPPRARPSRPCGSRWRAAGRHSGASTRVRGPLCCGPCGSRRGTHSRRQAAPPPGVQGQDPHGDLSSWSAGGAGTAGRRAELTDVYVCM